MLQPAFGVRRTQKPLRAMETLRANGFGSAASSRLRDSACPRKHTAKPLDVRPVSPASNMLQAPAGGLAFPALMGALRFGDVCQAVTGLRSLFGTATTHASSRGGLSRPLRQRQQSVPETDASMVPDAAPDSGHRDCCDLGNTGALEGESVYLSDGCTRCQCFAGGLVESDNDECQNKQSCTVGETVSHPSGVTVDCVCADAAGRRTCTTSSPISARDSVVAP